MKRPLVPLGIILITLIWGSTWLAIRLGLGSVPPLYGVALRFSVALVLLACILAIRRIGIPLDRDAAIVYVTIGLFSFSIPYALVYWSELYIASGLTAVLFAVFPFVVAVMSRYFLPDERLNAYKMTGILFAFLGILFIFWSDVRLGEASSLAMGAVLLSTLMQGATLMVIKRKGKHIDPMAMNAGGIIAGIPVMYGLALILEDFRDVRLDAPGIGSILYLGSLGTVVTFTVYYWLVKRVEAVYLSLISTVIPVIALILGALMLGEKLPPAVFGGSALVIVGLLLSNGRDLLGKLKSHRGVP